MLGDAAQAVVVPVDWAAFAAARIARPLALVVDTIDEQTDPSGASTVPGTPGGPSLATRLATAPDAERADLVEDTVRRLVGRVLRLPEARIDAGQSFGTLGLDSLMAIELRNRLEAEIGLKLSATMAWNYPTVRDLRAYVLGRLSPTVEGPETEPDAPRPAASAAVEQIAADVASLTDDDALVALMGGTEP